MIKQIFGIISEETPKYAVIKTTPEYEIRKYPTVIMAKTKTDSLTSGTGFREIANYIFGKEQGQEVPQAISMTAPVINSKEEMFFVMPSNFKTIEDLPKPLNIELVTEPEKIVGVKRFSGLTYDTTVDQYIKELEASLTKDSINFDPTPVLYRYNSPFTIPFMRTNEVVLKILDYKE